MLRDLGKQILHILSLPVRTYSAAVERLVSIRRFLDERRRHLAVAIIVAMMAVVGIKLRYTGYADAQPVEYLANAMPDEETIQGTKDAVSDSVTSVRSGLASLSARANEPAQKASVRVHPGVATTAVSVREIDDSSPIRERTLILPMPMVVSPPKVERPLLPERADAGSEETGEEPESRESDAVIASKADATPEEVESVKSPQQIATARLTGQIETDESLEYTVITPRGHSNPKSATGSRR